MSSEAAEVAEDYRLALEDLSTNMRFEISNLTVIARENTEHALVIAEVLEQHILKTAPSKKLPALYLLDSIVKNVGTPYTLYLGRNIFKTFMEAYTVVDHATRRRMEEMLKTWKQPVAGSMDTRPVFSHDLVRPIENALMKAKAAMMPQGQLPGRPRNGMATYRDNPTPPEMRSTTGTPGNFAAQPWPQPNGNQQVSVQANYQSQHLPHQQFSQNESSRPIYPQVQGAYGLIRLPHSMGSDVGTLNSDIENLVDAMRVEFSQSPHDGGIQTRLSALMDLQRIVQSTSLPPDQLELIKKQVTELAAVTLKTLPVQASSTSTSVQQSAPISVTPTMAPSAGQFPVTLDSLLGSGAMAALMARKTTSQAIAPQPAHKDVAVRPSHPSPTEAQKSRQAAEGTSLSTSVAPVQTQNTSSLMDQLRAAGLLPPMPASNTAVVSAPPPTIPINIANLLIQNAVPTWPIVAGTGLPALNSLSLKQKYKPEFIGQLYDGLGAPCSQCGRRFKADEEGRKKKTAHMDWHFRVHQRFTDAEKRGTHRSWFVDSADWLKSREMPDSESACSGPEGTGQGSADADVDKLKYIHVPEPGNGVNPVCPICQDRFENKWLDIAQEWVWLDTVLVAGRAYHASCHQEAMGDRDSGVVTGNGAVAGSIRLMGGVLGKRKAEEGLASPKARTLKLSI